METEIEVVPPSTIRWTEADSDLIRVLQSKTGITSMSDLVRLGLRALAAKEAA